MLRNNMEKTTWSPQSEIEMLKKAVAEEQQQKYAAYKRIEELQKEIEKLRRTS